MQTAKTKSIRGIEEKMENLDRQSFRYHVLESARNFKASWIELGRALYSVWKDKSYKEWGYSAFDAYTAKEIGIKKNTSMKLLRSYYFLEKEEPDYLKEEFVANTDTALVPTYESVDLLRMAKNKKALDEEDYSRFKRDIFEKGRDWREVKRDLTALIKERKEDDPEEAWQKRKVSTVRRFLGTLKALKKEIEVAKLLPAPLIKEASHLIARLEDELS